MDVKKLGRIPDDGGWRAGGGTVAQHASRRDTTLIGYDYVHSLIGDHSRFAYSEILPDEQGATCARFLLRAAASFTADGIGHVERVMTDKQAQLLVSFVNGPDTSLGGNCCPVTREGLAYEPDSVDSLVDP